MQSRGLEQSLDQQIHYVLAQAYPLVCRSKSMQDVYHDAFLDPKRIKQEVSAVPDEDRVRIASIVRSRDRFRVKQELDLVLGRFEPPARVLPALQTAFRTWAGKGVQLWRQHGPDGLKQFLGEIDYWLDKFRKKGGHCWVRHFINMFAYEAKVSFYTTFSNAWIGLIPWLHAYRGLDPVSERFLRIWHYQNQPIEILHGRTVSGLYYPTRIRYKFLLAAPGGGVIPHRFKIPTERIGPTHVPDVFSGQVLSLHPLSAFFMNDSALCAIAGRLFAAEDYEQILANGQAPYWDFVGAILTAANLYRHAAQEQVNGRGVCHQGGDAVLGLAIPSEANSQGQLLEDFAVTQKVTCPQCRGPVRFLRYEPVGDCDELRVQYECPGCKMPVPTVFPAASLVAWLRTD
jgi:hypothetical protein